MQQIKDVDARLERLTETLAHLLAGEFAKIDAYGEVEDDPLGRIEATVQSLVTDIETVSSANREKEAELATKSELLEVQRESIENHEQELRVKAETIERQAVAIRELSTPVLEVWDDVLVLPVIGTVDTQRSERIMSNLLDSIVEKRTQWVIIDITGVEVVDTRTADHLIKMVRAAGLLGTSCLLCGLQPAVAQTLVGVGVELTEIMTERNLKQALAHCVRQMHRARQV
jgi:rsbT co-antagonist protein RsbR